MGKRDPDASINGHRQHPAIVVVGVLADEIYATWSHCDPWLGTFAELGLEYGVQPGEPGGSLDHDAPTFITRSGRGFRHAPRVKSGNRKVSLPRAIDLPLSSTTALSIAAS